MKSSDIPSDQTMPHADEKSTTGDVILWLLIKPGVRLGPTCQSDVPVDDGAGRAVQCRRPIWGDGRVLTGKGNMRHDMCSRCWHMHNAFYGQYTTMQANPAAAKLDPTGIQRLTFHGEGHEPETDDELLYVPDWMLE